MTPDDLIRLARLAERRQEIRAELTEIERQLAAAGIEIETQRPPRAQPLAVVEPILVDRPKRERPAPTVQCLAKGLNGHRCTFPSKSGSHLCQRHTSMRAELIELSDEPATIKRCSARSAHGEVCARAALPGTERCKQHAEATVNGAQ